MGFKQQYHASTGKAKYEPTNKKAMGWKSNSDADCEHCDAGHTPKRIRVTFSGITKCTDCFLSGGGSKKYRHNFEINGSFILIQSSAEYPCNWRHTETDGVTLEVYSDENCTNKTDEQDEDVLFLVIRHAEDVFIHVYKAPFYYSTAYYRDDDAPIDSDCMNVTDSSSDYIDCGTPLHHHLGYGGTAIVEEL